MAKVIAVFDDGSKTEEASNQLTSAGYTDDIQVISPVAADPSPVEPVAAVTNPYGGNAAQGAVVIATGLDEDLGRLDLAEEETDFYRSRLSEGAELLVVETDDTQAVASLLQKAGADRVDIIN